MPADQPDAASSGYIDADGHVPDVTGAYSKYLEPPYEKRPLRERADGFDRTLFGTLGMHDRPRAKDWLHVLDSGRVETTVLYPTVGLMIGFVQEPEYAAACCRAYNNFVAREYTRHSPRLRAVAMLPLQDVHAAIAELRRAVADLGCVGAMLPADGHFLLGKPAFDPLYEEAQRLGVMVAVHGSGTLREHGNDEFLVDKFIQAHTLAHPFALQRQLTSMVFEGVPEKFPELRIAYLEAGCTWVPYWLDRMDEEYELRGRIEAPLLRKTPGEYFRAGKLYVTCEPEERLLPETAANIGEGAILYASDYPHWDGTFPQSLFELEARGDLTPELKTKILRDNPKRLYNLP